MRKKWLADPVPWGAVTKGRVPLRKSLGPVLFWMVLLSAWPCSTLRAQTAAELIEQAKQYDSGYTAGPEASQSTALDIYRKALAANPDPPQRLQILFRMAQLRSSAYLVHKGEKPDYRQAATLYERIIAAYPAREPLVIQSMTALADCLIVERRFDDALHWSHRVLEVDTKLWQDQIKALETADANHPGEPSGAPAPDPYLLQRTLRQIERTQRGAVDQVANAATGLGPLWLESQLKSLVQRYPGTCIEKRAQELLERHANAIADDLAPSRHIPLTSDTPVLHSPGPVGVPAPDSDNAGLSLSTVTPPPPPGGPATGPQRAGGTSLQQGPSRSPRGPPRTYVRYVIAGVAGLLMVVLAAQGLLRGSVRKGIKI